MTKNIKPCGECKGEGKICHMGLMPCGFCSASQNINKDCYNRHSCPSCNGARYEKIVEMIDIDIPKGYKFNGYRTESVDNASTLYGYEYCLFIDVHKNKLKIPLPYTIGQECDLICEDCGGCGKSNERDRCSPPNYYVCETCHGKKFKKKCEAIEVKGKQFKVVWSIRDV